MSGMSGLGSGIGYHVAVDFNHFKKIYLAQNRRYMRKTGIGAAVVGVLLTAAGIAMVITEPSGNSLGVLAGGVAIGAFGIAMAVHPFTMFQSRKGEVYKFFAMFGAPVTGQEPLNALYTEFDVILGNLGIEFRLRDGSVHRLPWVALTNPAVAMDCGHVFAGDDGNNSSLLHNMIGINAYLREGMEAVPLVVPSEVERAYPWLLDEISRHIADANAKFGDNGNAKGGPEAQAIIAWLNAAPEGGAALSRN